MKTYLLIVSLLVLGLMACQDNPSQPTFDPSPRIIAVQLPEVAYQFPRNPIGIHVRVEDPQGVENVAGVTLTVRRNNAILATLAMSDDGLNGDILSKDGQFFYPLDSTVTKNQTGQLVFETIATDRDNNASSARLDTLTILPGNENALPVITAVTVPEVIWSDSNYTAQFLATVDDADGIASLDFVRLEIYSAVSPTPSIIQNLRDDGQSGDGAAQDGVFGLRFDPATFKNTRSLFTMILRAVDRAGSVGPAIVRTVKTDLIACQNNRPPVVFDLSAPTTISRSATPNIYLLAISATDPDSACADAVARVFFNSFRPDGTPASGNPFAMRDDGLEGDLRANDKRYSLRIQITSQNQTGTYRFDFQAQDKNGALSSVVTHIINVTP